MNVNRVISQAYYENNNGGKAGNKNNGTGFYESLSENINGRNEETQKNVAVPRSAVPAKPYAYRNVPTVDDYESEIVNVASIVGCDVRQIEYQDADYAKSCVEQGFTLIAKVNTDNRSVYIECKREDGTVNGYEVSIDKIDGKTDNIFEQTALEAWGKSVLEKNIAETDGGSGDMLLTHEEALLQFYEYIEDIIKNGPPKYMIGNSEFSVDEWDKFLESIDEQLEDMIDETKERIEQLRAQQIGEEISKENEGVAVIVSVVSETEEETSDDDSEKKEDVAVVAQGDIRQTVNTDELAAQSGITPPVSADEVVVQSSSKQHINADEVAGLSTEQIKEQALSKWRTEMDGVPYGYMAKDGIIDYKGVIFVCDKKHKALHLGDTSDMKKCIRIPLSKGGCLIVNRDNIGDLSKAIGMFSPEDVNLILRAIAEDAKIQQMKQQIDEDESGIELVEDIDEAESELI